MINLCLMSDDKYLVGTVATLNSIKASLDTKTFSNILFWIINGGLSSENQSRLNDEFGVQFIDPKLNSLYSHMPQTNLQYLASTFYKLECFRLAKELCEPVLFVDSDIVFMSSIKELLETEITDDIGICWHSYPHKTYNSGLMIANPSAYPKIQKVYKQCKFSQTGEQGAINQWIENGDLSVHKIPTKWNTTKRDQLLTTDNYINSINKKEVVGIHFVSGKPWAESLDRRWDHLVELWAQFYSSI